MTEFVFANFFQIIKKYTNQNYSDLELVYYLFSKVNKDKDDEKTELKINKSQVSRILNRVDDVPKRIRNFYCDTKNKDELYSLFQEFLSDRFEEEREEDLSKELELLYTNDSSLEKKVKEYLDDFKNDEYLIYFAEIFKESLRRENKLSSYPVCIYSKGNTSVNVMVDDLIKISFVDRYMPGKKIVVIPVNTSFDLVVTDPGEKVQHVSELTLHGKWLKKMIEKKKDYNDLRDSIQMSL